MTAAKNTKIPERVGIFGGTFDPVHRAHIELAKAAVKQCHLDLLLIVPCHIPPHRETAIATGNQRVRMLELALENEAGIAISDYELSRESTSYSVETLKHFRAKFSDAELVFCLGGDSLKGLKSWFQWSQIMRLANLAVMGRSGLKIEELDKDLQASILQENEAFSRKSGQIRLLDIEEQSVSASEVRMQLQECLKRGSYKNAYLSHWLHPNVLKYLEQQQVYE